MKTNVLVVSAIAAVLLIASFAAAQDASTTVSASQTSVDINTNNVGMTPDSPFYGLKLGWEKLGVFFASNQQKKAELELSLADKRLAEAKVMADRGNVAGFEKAQAAHDALIAAAQARINALEQDGSVGQINQSISGINNLQINIDAHEARIASLNEVIANENLTDSARTAIESAISRMENRTEDMNQKLSDRKDRIKTRLMAVGGMNESEADAVVADLDKTSGLNEAQKIIAQNRIEKANASISKVEEKIAAAKANGVDVSAAEAKIAEYKVNIATAQAAFDAGNYSAAIADIKPVSNYGRQNSGIVQILHQERQDLRQARQNLTETGQERRNLRVNASAGDVGTSVNVNDGSVNVSAGDTQVDVNA